MCRPLIVSSLVFLLLISACHPNEDVSPVNPPDGWISITLLKTKHDYYMPFALKNDTNLILSATLNAKAIKFAQGDFINFPETGFYELVLIYNNTQQKTDTFLFTTKTTERENSEWGIGTWIPKSFQTTQIGNEEVEMYYPRSYVEGIQIPFIFYIKETGNIKPLYCKGIGNTVPDTFYIKRGVGSVNINSSLLTPQIFFTIGGKPMQASIAKKEEPFLELEGTISSHMVITSNSVVRIPRNLSISSTGSLTIHEGVLLLIDEAVDINLGGPLVFLGTAVNPVLLTCINENKFWGGFITRLPEGTIEAQYTIFCRSGYHNGGNYNWGHAQRQALFYTENSSLTLNHCFMTDHIGQIFYPQNSILALNDILVQRVKTGGQINTSNLTINNSVFTDFPNDSYSFMDTDNDALYLSASDATISGTTFMFAKDDGLDSGNNDGGTVIATNCRFEACFHEGVALSSKKPAVKLHSFTDCIFTNCGQGLELGFSSPNHVVMANDCQFLNNGVGIRYGDNYDWSLVEGQMEIVNSLSLNNNLDVWNMVHMNWSPKLDKISFENTKVSMFCPQYPNLEIAIQKK